LSPETTKEEFVNVIALIGNLATDVDLKELKGDKKVANFLLAIDRPGRDLEADFVWITVWDRQAETCAEYLAKGRRVAVDGRLRSRSWDEEGKRRTAVEVVANHVQFLSPPPGADAEIVPFEPAAAAAR
jgi:single-strand DNA-binding protein